MSMMQLLGISVVFLGLSVLMLWWKAHDLQRQIEDIGQASPGCSHPETKNVGTFGMPAYECVICHQIVELP